MNMEEKVKTYGALNFSGITQAGPFWKQIIDGRKKQTIRKPRKDDRPHVKVNHYTKLYWKVRTPIEKKPIHLIGLARIIIYEEITLAEMWHDENNALADGFANLEEFRDWFDPSTSWRGHRFGNGELDQYIFKRIKWDYLKREFEQTTL